jgi:hypothetical protein
MTFRPPEYPKWYDVIENHREDAQELLSNTLEQIRLPPIAMKILSAGYKLSGGHYTEEISAWAKALDVKEDAIITGNCCYELCQAGQYLAGVFPGLIGCTSVVTEVPSLGLVHIRNLDWDLPGMGQSTVVVHLENDAIAVTNPGFVGALSGLNTSEKFSVTLNWAPPHETPWFNFGPVFLTRWVLENAVDFDEAVAYLSDTQLSTPALFTVCGIDNACVIERTRKDYMIRYYEGQPLVVTNHYLTAEFEDRNNEDFIGDSNNRYKSALKAAKRFKGKSLESSLNILDNAVCCNDITVQQMAFVPSSGAYTVRALEI